MKKYIIMLMAVIVITLITLLVMRNIHLTKEHTLDLSLHGRYSIDSDGIRGYLRVRDHVPLTYFLIIRPGSDSGRTHSRNSVLESHRLKLPDELLADIVSSEESQYVLLSIGRELKEVKYRFTEKHRDGISIASMITFCEEYQNDTIYAYNVNERVRFAGEKYYIMNNDARVLIGNRYELIGMMQK